MLCYIKATPHLPGAASRFAGTSCLPLAVLLYTPTSGVTDSYPLSGGGAAFYLPPVKEASLDRLADSASQN
jgi:hypothetical protein